MVTTDPEKLPLVDRKTYVAYIEEKNNTIGLTEIELAFIKGKIKGLKPNLRHFHTRSLYDKIRKATDWNMPPTALICRLAYKHGIAQL